jgi:hypothetical protein
MLPCANAVESSRARRGRRRNVQGGRIFWKRLRNWTATLQGYRGTHSLSREVLLADTPARQQQAEAVTKPPVAGNA